MFFKRIINFFSAYKNLIYYCILIIFIILGLIYSIRGYNHYQGVVDIENGNDLLGIIFTPFVLAILRFLIVVCVGLFISTIIIAIPLRRIKLLQFEVEFTERATEIAEFQNKQMNQLNFLQKVLEEERSYVGYHSGNENSTYEAIIEDVFNTFESFFNEDLKTNLHIDILNEVDIEGLSDKRVKRLTHLIQKKDKDDFVIRNKSIIGNHIMLVRSDVGFEEFCVAMHSSEYEFGVYEAKIAKSLLEFSRIVYEKTILIDYIDS